MNLAILSQYYSYIDYRTYLYCSDKTQSSLANLLITSNVRALVKEVKAVFTRIESTSIITYRIF